MILLKDSNERRSMNHQRGSILLYGILALAVMAVALTVTWGLLNRCKDEKAKVEAAYAVLADRVKAQNEAIEGWEKAGKTAQDASRRAVERVRAEGKGLVKEVETLRQRLKDTKDSTCQAAILEIKQQLTR